MSNAEVLEARKTWKRIRDTDRVTGREARYWRQVSIPWTISCPICDEPLAFWATTEEAQVTLHWVICHNCDEYGSADYWRCPPVGSMEWCKRLYDDLAERCDWVRTHVETEVQWRYTNWSHDVIEAAYHKMNETYAATGSAEPLWPMKPEPYLHAVQTRLKLSFWREMAPSPQVFLCPLCTTPLTFLRGQGSYSAARMFSAGCKRCGLATGRFSTNHTGPDTPDTDMNGVFYRFASSSYLEKCWGLVPNLDAWIAEHAP